jgi:hypothetical protein
MFGHGIRLLIGAQSSDALKRLVGEPWRREELIGADPLLVVAQQ